MNIELPRDAEGREIPLDTEVLYDLCETKVSVKEFLFSTETKTKMAVHRAPVARTAAVFWNGRASDEGDDRLRAQ